MDDYNNDQRHRDLHAAIANSLLENSNPMRFYGGHNDPITDNGNESISIDEGENIVDKNGVVEGNKCLAVNAYAALKPYIPNSSKIFPLYMVQRLR